MKLNISTFQIFCTRHTELCTLLSVSNYQASLLQSSEIRENEVKHPFQLILAGRASSYFFPNLSQPSTILFYLSRSFNTKQSNKSRFPEVLPTEQLVLAPKKFRWISDSFRLLSDRIIHPDQLPVPIDPILTACGLEPWISLQATLKERNY